MRYLDSSFTLAFPPPPLCSPSSTRQYEGGERLAHPVRARDGVLWAVSRFGVGLRVFVFVCVYVMCQGIVF